MLDNQKRSTLTAQLVEKIRSDIRSGALAPGAKLPGERMLAEKYGICRVTVISALNRLEEEGLIDRIPQRGSFVKDHSLPAKVLLVCPSEQIGQFNELEQTFCFFEFHRGILTEAMERGVSLGIECIPCHECEANPKKFAKLVEEYDAIVFLTEALGELRREFYGKKRLVVNAPRYFSAEDAENSIYLSYDQYKAFHDLQVKARELGWNKCTVVMMTDEPWFKERCRRFCHEAEKLAMEVEVINCFEDTPADILHRCRGTFVFCNHTGLFNVFYRKCREAGLVPGKDFALSGLCTGLTLTNLDPLPGFLKIPQYELGREAMRWALGLPGTQTKLDTTIVEGKTIRNPEKF